MPGERASGEREIAIDDFLVGPYETALAHNEVLIEVRIPLRHNTSSAYAKVERRVGDWAITAAGAAVTLDGQTILAARVGLTAVNPDPVALAELSAGLVGQPATEEVFAEAGRRAAQACTPVTDVRGTAEYKRHLAGELTVRTLRTAAGRVLGAPAAPRPERETNHAGEHDGKRRACHRRGRTPDAAGPFSP